MKRYKVITGIIVSVLGIIMVGCGSIGGMENASDTASYSTMAMDAGSGLYDKASMAEVEYEDSVESSTLDVGIQDNRKLIKTVNLGAETEQYDETLNAISNKVTALGGYIESLTMSGQDMDRYANIQARIPVEKLDLFVEDVETVSNITYRNEYVEDVTLTYVDLDSRKQMLLTEESRLLELMEQAETMEDIIALESQLTEVRYQIESMESQLRTFDNQIAYSTVTISISEVKRVTPMTAESSWERMANGFVQNIYRVGEGLQEFGILFVINLPFLILFAIIVVVIIALVKVLMYIRKRNKERHGK